MIVTDHAGVGAPGLPASASFTAQLAWVFTWHEVPATFISSHRTSQLGPGNRGRVVVGAGIVDASTGDVLAVLENGFELPPSARAAGGHAVWSPIDTP
jgi:hypothetical protein